MVLKVLSDAVNDVRVTAGAQDFGAGMGNDVFVCVVDGQVIVVDEGAVEFLYGFILRISVHIGECLRPFGEVLRAIVIIDGSIGGIGVTAHTMPASGKDCLLSGL